ncbi:hypothetical protein GF342_03745 [Candidatus Woesearchaeota archaeon]|nr:hypothetical protein [Candidatus Woesearchaeota archaeon]
MKNRRFGLIAVMLLLIAGLAVSAQAFDISITKTEINGVEVFPDNYVSLDLEKGGELELEVEFTALDDLDDVEVRAVILSSEEDIEEVLPLFDVREDTEYKKELTLELPREVDEDEYRIMVIISDRDDEITETYNIYVNSRRHLLAIEDVILHPFGRVQAGEFVLAKVRLENFGQKDERNARIMVSIPELETQAVTYINEIEFDDQAETEELLLIIPECAEEKQYRMNIVVEYNEGRDHLTEERTIFVRENPACSTDQEDDDEPAVIVLTQDGADNADGTEATGAAVADASDSEESSWTVRNVLEVALLALVVLLVIVGLLIGFMKLRSDD